MWKSQESVSSVIVVDQVLALKWSFLKGPRTLGLEVSLERTKSGMQSAQPGGGA